MSSESSAYRDAGVDIDAKYAAVKNSHAKIRSTHTAGVVGDVGQFGGLFDLALAGAEGDLLVASTDGVGTKVQIASRAGRLEGVGADLVNHCVNDILVQGARPLFFLDYIAVAKMVPAQVEELITGLARACKENGCALLGGETAEMPGTYIEGELDLAGTIVGAVSRARLLDGRRIAVGHQWIALQSSGLHTNGYSLARAILFDLLHHDLDDRPAVLEGQSIGEALLEEHRSYLSLVRPLLQRDLVSGLAHITGGGLPDNLPRVLPGGTAARIEVEAVQRPPIFDLLVTGGEISREEAYRVFNMGFGFLLCVAAEDVAAVQGDLRGRGEASWVCGEVIEGDRTVELC